MPATVLEFANEAQYRYWVENCATIPPDEWRVVGIGVIGCAVACISVVFNVFLVFLLARNRKHRSSHLIYLLFLAVFDIFVSINYVMLFPINIYMDFFDSAGLAQAWYTYMPVALVASHVAITASAFLIVAAAFERFVTISKIRTQFAKRNRYLISVSCVVFALVAKGPMMLEMENSNCTGVSEWMPNRISWIDSETMRNLYEFWFRSIITALMPFFACFYLNIQIIRRLRLQHQGAKLFRFATSEHRQNIRSATLMLVCVASSYLASNLLNVITQIFEIIDVNMLKSEAIRPFYTISSDLVSLLTVISCCARLPIYFACNARIRTEVLEVFDSCLYYIAPHSLRNMKKTASRRIPLKPRCYGTGLDKVVLSVALTGMTGVRRFSAQGRLDAEATEMDFLRPVLHETRRQSDVC